MEEQLKEEEIIVSEGDLANPNQPKYAGFWIRFLAFLIDFLLFLLFFSAYGLLIFFLSLHNGEMERTARYSLENNFSYLKYFHWIFLFICGITGIVFVKFFQTTPGKMILKLIIIPIEEEIELSWKKVILREVIGKPISVVVFFLGFLWVGFDKKKRSFHDMISKTSVVYKDSEDKKYFLILKGALALFFEIIIIFGIVLIFRAVLTGMYDAVSKGAVAQAIDKNISEKRNNQETNVIPQYSFDSLTSYYCQFDKERFSMTNVSPDGKNLATFLQKCKSKDKYFCSDTKNGPNVIFEVDLDYILSGKSVCKTDKQS